MKAIHGIQMIGTQRSGSNLLRVIMDQSPEIAAPHPPHILVTFMPLLHLYKPLLDPENYKQLITDVVDYVNANPVLWAGVKLDKYAIFERSETYSLYEINSLVYEQAALSKNAAVWLCKSMNNMYYSTELEKHGSVQKYIYLYRDGRDVAASFKKAVVGEKHIFAIAGQWKKDQEECLRLKNVIPADRFLSLSYEDLIHNPEISIQTVCDFLNINFTGDMLQYYTSDTSKMTAASGAMWRNLEKPIMINNTGKFTESFEGDDLDIFELVAGNILSQLGYPLYTSADKHYLIADDNIEEYKKENIRLKELSLAIAAKSDMDKRKPQEQILAQIKERIKV